MKYLYFFITFCTGMILIFISFLFIEIDKRYKTNEALLANYNTDIETLSKNYKLQNDSLHFYKNWVKFCGDKI